MERWSSRLVFVLAAIGSAVGIGNIWRFPMVVGQNGGGAYLIPYFLAVVGLAIPLMILEMAVGRHWRRNLVASFGRAGKRFEIVGWLICLIVLLILSYYLVIMDATVGTIGLPIAALLVAITFRWLIDDDILAGQANLSDGWLRALRTLTKYVIPAALLLITVA